MKKKSKQARSRKTTPTRAERAGASLGAAKAGGSSTPDSTLLIGGLALVVLVLGDTIFLGLSARVLRLG